MIAVLVVAVLAGALAVYAYRKKSGEAYEQEEQNNCQTCLRWPECNGVDKDCPFR